MKKSDYEKLFDAEKEFVPEHFVTLSEFWVDKITHYHILHRGQDYMIIRSWFTGTGEPAVSIDVVKGNLVEVLSYVVSRFASQTEHAPIIEGD